MVKNNIRSRPDRRGENNPMYGRHHTAITRQKQSDAAIKRYQQYNQPHPQVTMDEFLNNNPKVEEYIKTLVKEQIDKFIWNNCQKQSPLNIWL